MDPAFLDVDKLTGEENVSVINRLTGKKVNIVEMLNEPQQDKINKMTCAPSKDTDQPARLRSLVRVFAVDVKNPWMVGYTLSAQQRLIRLGGCKG